MIASFGNSTLVSRVKFPKLAIMKPAAGQPRLPRPYQDDYAYYAHDLTWWTRGSDLGVALGQAGTYGNDTPTLNKPQ